MKKYIKYIVIAIMVLSIMAGIIVAYTRKNKEIKEDDNFKIVTSFYPIYVMTANIVDGAKNVTLDNMTEANTGCVHNYTLTTSDMKKIEKANILGFSDGGNIAVIFALKYPERVASLVLNGANLFPSGLKSSFLIPVKVLFAVFSLLSHFSRRAKRRSELLYLMAKQPNIQPERLSSIKCPVLVIAGTQDVIKEKHTKLIAASLPDSSLCFLKGGHSIAKTNSVEFNSTVEKFLNSL